MEHQEIFSKIYFFLHILVKNGNGKSFHYRLGVSKYTIINDPYRVWAAHMSICWTSGISSKCSILVTCVSKEDGSYMGIAIKLL